MGQNMYFNDRLIDVAQYKIFVGYQNLPFLEFFFTILLEFWKMTLFDMQTF